MNWKLQIAKGALLSVGLIGSILVVFFIFKGFIGIDRLLEIKGFFFTTEPIDSETIMNLKKLGTSDKILPFNSIFTQTLAYYDTIITILIGILGVVIAIAFVYIKYNSEEKSREHAEKYMENYLKTTSFRDMVEEMAEKIAKDRIESWGEDITKGFERIEQLEKNVEQIKRKVASLEEDRKESNESLDKD